MSDRAITFGLLALFLVVTGYAISSAANKRLNQPIDFGTSARCSIADYQRCGEGDYIVANNVDFIKRTEKSWDTSVMAALCGENWEKEGHTTEDARGERTYLCRLKNPRDINHESAQQYIALQHRSGSQP